MMNQCFKLLTEVFQYFTHFVVTSVIKKIPYVLCTSGGWSFRFSELPNNLSELGNNLNIRCQFKKYPTLCLIFPRQRLE